MVFTIKSGSGADAQTVETFISSAEKVRRQYEYSRDELRCVLSECTPTSGCRSQAGWVDVRSHPLGLESPAIRITMYNPQVAEITPRSREACAEIAHRDTRPDKRCDLGARFRRGARA